MAKWDGRCVSGILHHAYRVLQKAGCDSPELDAELLLASVLGWDRARLLAHSDHMLTEIELASWLALLGRRQGREPLAYILGRREFYGLDFIVDRRVLIPRPETELVVEHVLAWAASRTGPLDLADVGTGSGCIAVALAAHLPGTTIHALDASADSLEVAAANVARHALGEQVILLQSDLLEQLPGRVDGIIANLPYVRSDEMPVLQPEIREHEPWAALDGGPDGLGPVRRLLVQAVRYLSPAGAVFLEIGAEQGMAAREIARHHFPNGKTQVLPDYAGLDRILQVRT
ncbi:MAG TPA: peptide chain release factor N(5)-glutamine methyltransferase [Anaerolineae bacterium]|nr:peptide chain release factor N(5)-glutamine methyltransferase [Anaerolineae bacterium]